MTSPTPKPLPFSAETHQHDEVFYSMDSNVMARCMKELWTADQQVQSLTRWVEMGYNFAFNANSVTYEDRVKIMAATLARQIPHKLPDYFSTCRSCHETALAKAEELVVALRNMSVMFDAALVVNPDAL